MKHTFGNKINFSRTLCATAVTLACLGSQAAFAQDAEDGIEKGKLEKGDGNQVGTTHKETLHGK